MGLRSANMRICIGTAMVIGPAGFAHAHDPILSCFENSNGSVTCEAGYSDGASASGQLIRVMLANKRLVLEDKFPRNSAFTFKRPAGDFVVEFIGDSAHRATFDSEDLGK